MYVVTAVSGGVLVGGGLVHPSETKLAKGPLSVSREMTFAFLSIWIMACWFGGMVMGQPVFHDVLVCHQAVTGIWFPSARMEFILSDWEVVVM